MKLRILFLAGALAASASLVYAHLEHEKRADRPRSVEDMPFGREGDPKNISRTIDVDMDDHLRYHPSRITVKQGETIRFRVKNSGRAMHEMVLGTMAGLKEHAKVMRKHSSMVHDEPFMAHVEPGKTETLVWHFTRPGEFYYGCLVPGHLEGGMVGTIVVQSPK